ncbi:SigE family RNA polymerase sigma factor [Nocardioides sp.]|uniref:SigE family RNA polymerase sigma factor n=1 Tax=Nocardioides sp. TaxID=35761 RepID=UPI002BDF8F39|nr:SigE family RNA polymerase sigma factor [Nocardioides sp.]HXH76932.1 SigE family RNA polymerase sigma factor [Nocardioides sp.]
MSTAPDFDEWVAARGQPLLRLAYVLTGDPVEAEEIVEDALSRALPRWSRISRRHDPDASVRRLVVRAHVSRLRRFRRRHAPPPPPLELVATTGITIEVPDLIWPACGSLPRDQRTALVLCYYEGLSDEEIADLTGVRAGSVRSQISQGIAAVRAELAEL